MMVISIKQYLSNVWRSIHEKPMQNYGWVEKKCCLLKKCVVLNWRRLSYFRLFTHDIISQNTTHSDIYIRKYITWEGEERVDEESNKKI